MTPAEGAGSLDLERARAGIVSPAGLLALTAALFALVMALRLIVTLPGFGVTLLFDVPVALAAIAFGLRGGLTAATVGLALFAIADATSPITTHGMAIYTNVAGYVSRALAFYLVGGLVGAYSDRLRDTREQLVGLLGELATGRARLQAIIDHMPGAISLRDLDGRYVLVNQYLASALGERPEDLTGRDPVEDHGDVETLDQIRADDREMLSTRQPVTRELTITQADGQQHDYYVLKYPVLDAEGSVTGFGSFSIDITDRKAAEDALARSNDQLEQFAYVASHDLQEPLRTISGFAELLDGRHRAKLDDEAGEFLDYILRGTRRMQALIDDLLAYSRVNQAELPRERVDAREPVEHALASLDATVRDTGAQVVVGDLPTIVANEAAMAQLFQNLISNALKFANDGPPRVEISADQADGTPTFAVADHGLGIAPAHTERIFRMYERLHSQDEYGGTGMGLAICRRVVERHGGRIWCEPRPGGGTVFRFTIPEGASAAA